jgi:TolB-like protein
MRLILLTLLVVPALARGQSVAMLDMAMYNARANVQEPTDSAKAVIATEKLRDTLSRFPGVALVDSARIAAAEASPAAVEAAGGKPCNVIVACARAVGKALGVRWVVMGKVSKTSNLIWLFSGELIDVETGQLLLDDDCELKGDPDTMVPAGVGLFANRIDKRITAGS